MFLHREREREKYNSLDNIINSEKARQFRRSMLDGSWKYCNRDRCYFIINKYLAERSAYPDLGETISPESLKSITLSYDKECNFACVMCRDKRHFNSMEKTSELEDMFNRFLLPLAKNLETIYLSGAGELFASRHMKALLPKLTNNTNAIFKIITNGSLANLENFKKFGLWGKTNGAMVSMHAIRPETHRIITRTDTFKAVRDNVVFMANALHRGEINYLSLTCVVCAHNIFDMVPLAEFAQNLNPNITVHYFAARNETSSFASYNALDPQKPVYNDLKRELFKLKNFKNACIYPELLACLDEKEIGN